MKTIMIKFMEKGIVPLYSGIYQRKMDHAKEYLKCHKKMLKPFL